MTAPIRAWPILLGAALLLSLAMGIRQSLGLFMQPMTAAGITVADFTFSIAVQNVVWGLSQPFVGAAADRLGFRRVAMAGAGLYAATEGDEPLDGLDEAAARSTLAERFIVPPFSVLDARQGYWQDRKRAWIALGLSLIHI